MVASELSMRVGAAVRGVVGDGAQVALHEPEFRGHEWDYVKSCLDDGWVSTAGPFVERFERELAAATGRSHAVACMNGTAALHLALRIVGVEAGDEVLVPALTFVATANSVHHCGAIPHFVDCEEESLGVCPVALERHLAEVATATPGGGCVNRRTGRPIKALVPVHIFGHPAQMGELCQLTERYGIVVVEDATEAIGSRYQGTPVGGHGAASVLSFNGNKIVTTGGGGALVTDDCTLADKARHVATTAKLPHPWAFVHDEVGYNYRMPNINAALGCAQLERLGDFLTRKRALATHYIAAFREMNEVRVLQDRPGAEANYWLNAIILQPELAASRDELLKSLNDAGLQCRPTWEPMHRLPFHRDCPRAALPLTESIAARLINLPSSPKLADRFVS